MEYGNVQRDMFQAAIGSAQQQSSLIRNMTSSPEEFSAPGQFYLSTDIQSGFAIMATGEIAGVFSVSRGRGSEILENAKQKGGQWLDCFDGYLPGFYAAHGFVETSREKNWTPGGPDVVYMRVR